MDLELLEKQQSTLLIQKVNTSLSAYNSSAIGTWEILRLVEKGLWFWVFVCVLNLYLIKITKIFFPLCFFYKWYIFGCPHSS